MATEPSLDQLRYPIGPWQEQPAYTPAYLAQLLARIRSVPADYAALTASLPDADLAKQYRAGSFTVRQLVHHVADTHLMHLFRFKNALLTPGQPALMADVNGWAGLEEARTAPVAPSLTLLDGVHQRIAFLGETLTPDQLAITYHHAIRQRDVTLAQALDMVVWHTEHHLAHIRLALDS